MEEGHKFGKMIFLALIGWLLLIVSSKSVCGQQQQGKLAPELDAELLAGGRRVISGGGGTSDNRLLDWQLERLINRALEDGLNKRSSTNNLSSQQQQQAAAMSAANRRHYVMQQLLDTIPRPAQRSTNSWPLASFSGRNERRSPQQPSALPPGMLPQFQVGALDTLDQLSAILEGDNLARLGRAFKPRTMSTARGFGKRSSDSGMQMRSDGLD